MARYFCEIVDSAVSRIVVGSDSSTPETIANLLGGSWLETADPYTTKTAYPSLGMSSSIIQPPKIAGATTFSAAVKIVDTADYAAWPYDLLNYDSSRSKLWFCYMQADDHVTGDCNVMFATINTVDDSISASSVAVTNATYRCVCHASCVAANNDYLLAVMYRDKTTGETLSSGMWRSTDGGENWSDEGDFVNAEDTSVGVLQPHGLFVSALGTIILHDLDGNVIHRSTDNGLTWSSAISITNNVAGTAPLEPGFWQHPTSGRIIAIFRAGQAGSQPNPLFTYSDDDGATWAEMSEAPDWWKQYSNPAAIIYHSDDEIVEAFVSHRYYDALPPRIFQTTTTLDGVLSFDFGGMELLFGGTSTGKDFGYPSAVRVGDKVYLLWYNGSEIDTDIWMAVGTR